MSKYNDFTSDEKETEYIETVDDMDIQNFLEGLRHTDDMDDYSWDEEEETTENADMNNIDIPIDSEALLEESQIDDILRYVDSILKKGSSTDLESFMAYRDPDCYVAEKLILRSVMLYLWETNQAVDTRMRDLISQTMEMFMDMLRRGPENDATSMLFSLINRRPRYSGVSVNGLKDLEMHYLTLAFSRTDLRMDYILSDICYKMTEALGTAGIYYATPNYDYGPTRTYYNQYGREEQPSETHDKSTKTIFSDTKNAHSSRESVTSQFYAQYSEIFAERDQKKKKMEDIKNSKAQTKTEVIRMNGSVMFKTNRKVDEG